MTLRQNLHELLREKLSHEVENAPVSSFLVHIKFFPKVSADLVGFILTVRRRRDDHSHGFIL
jgi:hypothetical protein